MLFLVRNKVEEHAFGDAPFAYGLERTQSGLASIGVRGCLFDFLGNGVTGGVWGGVTVVGERWRDALRSGKGGGDSRRLSSLCTPRIPPRSLDLRRSVARSGLDDVPGDLYMERRFTWWSLSAAASPKTSPDDDDADAEGEPVKRIDDPAAGVGVGGTMVGVAG